MEAEKIYKEVIDLYLANPSISAVVSDDGDLIVRHYMTPGKPIFSIITEEGDGFVVTMGFPVGAESGKDSFARGINELNRSIRCGSFFVDTDGELMFRVFVNGDRGVDGKDIARAISIGVGTFLDRRNEIAKILEPISSLKDSEFVINEEEHVGGR